MPRHVTIPVLILACGLLLCLGQGCESDPDDEQPDDAWQATVDDVRAVVEADCSVDALATLDGAEPATVREALVTLDAELKLTEWTAGVTHGHPIEYTAFRTPLLNDFQFDYTLYVPEAYTADPDQALPLFFSPGHPVDDVQDDLTFPYMADLLDEPFLFAQDNTYNRLYTDLGEDGYYEEVYYSPDFDDVAVYQDHQEIVRDVLRQIRRDYVVDSSRMYVGGVSAEGNASWSHGIQSADRFAALLPVSAGTALYDDELWRNLLQVSVLAVHGTDDELCPVEDVDALVEQLEAWGVDVEYWREEGEGHGTMFYGEFADMIDWLLQRQRDLTPDAVHKALMSDRDTDVYWRGAIELAEPPARTATMVPPAPVAEIDGNWSDGDLDVQTAGVASFTARWLESAGAAVSLTVDGEDRGEVELVEDPTVAIEDYCRHADVERLWAGRVEVQVP